MHSRNIHIYKHTAMPIIIEGRFQVFQRFSSSKLVLKTVESCFVTLNYYGNGSTCSGWSTHAYSNVWKSVEDTPFIQLHSRTYTHTYTYIRIYTCTLHIDSQPRVALPRTHIEMSGKVTFRHFICLLRRMS